MSLKRGIKWSLVIFLVVNLISNTSKLSKEFEKLEKTELRKLEEKIEKINNKAKTEIQKKYENEQKD